MLDRKLLCAACRSALLSALGAFACTGPPPAASPSAQTPSAQTPSAQTPSAVSPGAVSPSAQTPSAVSPGVASPSVASPSAQTPSVQTPSVQTPSAASPSAQTPSAEVSPASGAEAAEGGGAPVAEGPSATAAVGEGAQASAPAGDTGGGDFKRLDTHTARETRGVAATQRKPTQTEALLKFVVIDKGKGAPIEGVVVSLKREDGSKYYTAPTDAVGYADVLVPAGEQYEVVYLSLNGKDIAAKLTVEDKERLTLKLTLRYEARPGGAEVPLILRGIHFDTGKAKIRPESFPRLDSVAEYLIHKKSARLEISGHTDSVGNKGKNKRLSKRRAEACRAYLISKGVSGSRLKAVGYGDERPIAPNSTPEGRQRNRRIEAIELGQ